MANKFKVGDIVVGNKKANDNYAITTKGSKLKITKVYSDGTFEGEMISNPPFNYHTGIKFGVGDTGLKPECFDLVTEGYKIIITADGVTTTAKMYCGKTVIKNAEAKCAPGDKFDFEFGARLAMDRLVEDTRDSKIKALKQQVNSVYGSPIQFKNTRSFSFTGTFDGTKFLEAMKIKKTPKVLSIEDFDWVDFKKGECAIMVHTRTAYDEMLRRIKRRFCPSTPLDISGYYCGHSGYLHYGRDEKLRFTANDPDIDYIGASKFLKKRINMSDDDWKAFDNYDMTLRVTEDVEDDVLLTLKCLGYTWRNGEDMTSWLPGLDDDEYYLTKDVKDGLIGFMPVEGLDYLSAPPHHVSSIKIVKKI
jgi:hypothetical protein